MAVTWLQLFPQCMQLHRKVTLTVPPSILERVNHSSNSRTFVQQMLRQVKEIVGFTNSVG